MAVEKESSQTWLLTELLELKKSAQPSTVETALIPEQLSHMRVGGGGGGGGGGGSETATIPEVCGLLCNS